MGKAKFDNSFSNIERFIRSSEAISRLFQKYETECVPFYSSHLPHFSALDSRKQEEAVFILEMYKKSLQNSENNFGSLKNNGDLLWQAIKDLGYRQPSGFFACLEPDDVIEIYDSQNLQIWRNINFMKICSYTLEEMLCLPWYERYDRDNEDTEKIIKSVQKVMGSKEPTYLNEAIGNHIFEEKTSRKQFVLNARHDYFCPLFGESGSPEAFVVTSKVKILKQKRIEPQSCRDSLKLNSRQIDL